MKAMALFQEQLKGKLNKITIQLVLSIKELPLSKINTL